MQLKKLHQVIMNKGDKMREKQVRIIVTFNTTTGAMAMEKACKAENIPGRLIPVPRQISAGCGLSWLCNKEDREKIQSLIDNNNLEYNNIHEILM